MGLFSKTKEIKLVRINKKYEKEAPEVRIEEYTSNGKPIGSYCVLTGKQTLIGDIPASENKFMQANFKKIKNITYSNGVVTFKY